jgi:hypothetical protein
MPTPSDNANARETTRMVASYADSVIPANGIVNLTAPERAGITPTRWVAYLTGHATMTLPVQHAIARVLGLSVGQLLTKAEARHRG